MKGEPRMIDLSMVAPDPAAPVPIKIAPRNASFDQFIADMISPTPEQSSFQAMLKRAMLGQRTRPRADE